MAEIKIGGKTRFENLLKQLFHSPLLDMKFNKSMWFSVVCTLIDNDTRHHSGQNVVDNKF